MASGTITVKLVGGEELLAALRAVNANVQAALRTAGLAGAQPVVDAANSLAPGPHIMAEVVEVTGAGVEVLIGPDKEHWHYRFFELGAAAHEITGTPLVFEGRAGVVTTARVMHPGMTARPFLRPAHDAKHDAMRDAMGAALRQAIEESV